MSTSDPKSFKGAGPNRVTGIATDTTGYSINLDPATLNMSYSIPSTWVTTAANSGTYTGTSYSTNWNTPISTNGITLDPNADIKIGDKSLVETLNKIEDRLAILTADPKKLEKFAALKKAYEQYKLMEKLCQEDEEKK